MVASFGRDDDCGAIEAEDDANGGGNGAPHLDCLDCCLLMSVVVLLVGLIVACFLLGFWLLDDMDELEDGL